jgi:hypothetical protein
MKMIFVIFLTIFVTACGWTGQIDQVNPADKQLTSDLVLPEAGGGVDVSFGLTAEDQKLEYLGSLLFWAPTVSVQQIQAISVNSKAGRDLRAGALAIINEEVVPAKTELFALTNQREKLEEQITAEKLAKRTESLAVIEAQKAVTAPFFDRRLEQLVTEGSLTADQKKHAQERFPLYCEYKMWELATNLMLKHNFALRPTPLEMCEGYYQGKYFQDQNLCGPAKDSKTGKNYFTCIWREGVLKSPLLTVGLKNGQCNDGSDGAQAIKKWVDGGQLYKIFEATTGDKDYVSTFANAVLGGNILLRKIRRLDEAFDTCKNAFLKPNGEEEVAGWAKEPPRSFRNIGEASRQTALVGKGYFLLPVSELEADNERNWNMLTKYIWKFAQRVIPEDEATYSISVGDEYNNLPVDRSFSADVSLKEQVFSDPVFKPLLEIDDQLVSAELKEKRTRLDVGIEAQALAVQLALKPLSYRADRIRRHSFKGGALVKDQGAATYLNALSLTVQKSGDQVHVKFKLGEGKTFVGCVNQNTGLSCSSQPLAEEGLLDSLYYEAESGKLIFDQNIGKAADHGFAPRARDGAVYFNTIPVSDVEGSVLHMEVSAGKVGALDWISGSAKILAGGKELHSGSSSADNFVQQTAE